MPVSLPLFFRGDWCIVCVFYRILIGFMLPSWFLSMWLSNTATTGMMIPVAEKVIDQLWSQQQNRQPTTAASYAALYGIG